MISQQNGKYGYTELKQQTENHGTKPYFFTTTHTCTNWLFQGHV